MPICCAAAFIRIPLTTLQTTEPSFVSLLDAFYFLLSTINELSFDLQPDLVFFSDFLPESESM